MAATGKRHFPHTTPDVATDAVFQNLTDGAAHVRPLPGPQTQSRNRNLVDIAETHPGDDTTNTVTWVAADNITELTIIATANNDTAGSNVAAQSIFVGVVFNAVTAAQAVLLLDGLATDSATQDVQWYKIPLGIPTTFRFTSAITRADFASVDPVGAGVIDVWVGAN